MSAKRYTNARAELSKGFGSKMDALVDGPEYGNQLQEDLNVLIEQRQAAKELREGKMWKPPTPEATGDTFLTPVLKRFGHIPNEIARSPEVTQMKSDIQEQLMPDTSSIFTSIKKRLGIK